MTKLELEADLEDRCVARVEALGGAALKLAPPVGRGFPDRTVLLPADVEGMLNPGVFFAEMKRPKRGVTAHQQHAWRVLLVQLGFKVYTIASDEDFTRALEEHGFGR